LWFIKKTQSQTLQNFKKETIMKIFTEIFKKIKIQNIGH
jgi:hypothetical protein